MATAGPSVRASGMVFALRTAFNLRFKAIIFLSLGLGDHEARLRESPLSSGSASAGLGAIGQRQCRGENGDGAGNNSKTLEHGFLHLASNQKELVFTFLCWGFCPTP